MADALTALGLVAGGLTSLAFAPQVARAWRTKRLHDVSPVTMGALSVGLLLWMLYGFFRSDPAIVVSNAVGLALTSTVLALWFRYGRQP